MHPQHNPGIFTPLPGFLNPQHTPIRPLMPQLACQRPELPEAPCPCSKAAHQAAKLCMASLIPTSAPVPSLFLVRNFPLQ